MTRAAIYLRVSENRTDEEANTISNHRTDCEALCKREGWTVVGEYVDDGYTATGGKHRPAFDRMTRDAANGAFDVIVAWHDDRLWRSVADQQAVLAMAQVVGLKLLATVNGGRYDPSDAGDEFMSTIQAAVAARESADKSRRLLRRQAQKAEDGEWHGGRRGFGHTSNGKGGLKLVPSEAKAIRDAARRVLRGESVSSIVLDWNARGITTTTGGRWRVDTLASLLQQPRLAGLRSHHGTVTAGSWPTIIDMETHERLVAMFDSRRRGPRLPRPRTRLLTGLLRCGKCGASMVSSRDSTATARYVCPAKPSGGCGGMSVTGAHVEEAVRDLILDHLDSDEFADALHRAREAASSNSDEVEKAADRLTRDRARLVELGDLFADGEVDRAEYRRLVARVQTRLVQDEAVVERARAVVPALAYEGQVEQVAKAWEHMTLGERRTVIDALAEGFVIRSAVRPVNVWNSDRVDPCWRF